LEAKTDFYRKTRFKTNFLKLKQIFEAKIVFFQPKIMFIDFLAKKSDPVVKEKKPSIIILL